MLSSINWYCPKVYKILYFIKILCVLIYQVDPPRGWSFEPTEVTLNVDGITDDCSQGKDINFTFKGFGITGRVSSKLSLLYENILKNIMI